jgi:hypothetical protein|tara:strand:- start:215 stop:487 length:273 start_codon:yes stop_codon:yes gene_type:complete
MNLIILINFAQVPEKSPVPVNNERRKAEEGLSSKTKDVMERMLIMFQERDKEIKIPAKSAHKTKFIKAVVESGYFNYEKDQWPKNGTTCK